VVRLSDPVAPSSGAGTAGAVADRPPPADGGSGGTPARAARGPRHAASQHGSASRLTGLQWAIVLTAAVTLVNMIWVLRDSTAPSWDQSHYLNLTWYYQQALDHHGPGALLHAVYTSDPSRAPLLSLLMLPLAYVFGPGPGMGLALNTLLWPVLLLSAGAVAKELFDDRARLLAIAILASMPLVMALSHTVLQDFLLLTLTTLGVLLLIRSRRFSNWKACIGLGLVVALGMLTKFSFFVGVAGPAAVTLVAAAIGWAGAHRAEGDWRATRVALRNLAVVGILAIVPSLLWYVPNWSATAAYLRTQYSLQAGAIADPLIPSHVTSFLIGTGANMSWLWVVLALVVGVLSLSRLIRWLGERGGRRGDVLTAALLGSWLLIPVAVVAANVNQDPRYVIAAYPALAVTVAGLISGLGSTALRRLLVGAIVVFGATQVLQVNVPSYHVPLLPSAMSINTADGSITVPLAGADGPAVPPLPRNYTLDVLEYLESKSQGPGGRIEPKMVDIVELHPAVNGNNLTYYALVRHDPFTFFTEDAAASQRALATALRAADFVLYIRQPHVGSPGTSGRVGQLNSVAAARFMTPAMFAMFRPDPRRIFVGADSGQGPFMAVLQRR